MHANRFIQRNIPMQTKKEYIIFATKFLEEFKANYKSSEDYHPRHLFPIINLQNLKTLVDTKNINVLKHFLVSSATGNLYPLLLGIYYDTYKEPLQRIACDQVILQLTKHGECGILSGGMVYDLIGKNIPLVMRYNVDEDLHSFIVISNKDETIKIAIDPFFGFVCPLEEYRSNKQFIQYGKSLKSPNWTSQSANYTAQSYGQELLNNHTKALKTQITNLLKLVNTPKIQELSALCHYALSLTDNFDEREMIVHLRNIFKQNITNEFSRFYSNTKEYLGFTDIDLLLNISLPLPPEKVRTNIEDTSLITYLKQKTALQFFGTVDNDYNVDALAPISTKEERSTAEHLHKATNCGRFFKNKYGSSFFIIENINETPNSSIKDYQSIGQLIQSYVIK